MEDAHIAKLDLEGKDIHIFGVFDGHGGPEVAKFVAAHFVDELLANASYKAGNYESALTENFKRMDDLMKTVEGKREVMDYARGSAEDTPGESYAGCTANVALIVGDMLYVANAGDSRSVISSKGKACDMSTDHKPDDEIEFKRITAAGATVSCGRVNGNINLSRAMGDFEYKNTAGKEYHEQAVTCHPDIVTRRLSDSDGYLIMGCDGVFEQHSNQELVTLVEGFLNDNTGDLKVVSEKLLDSLLAPDTAAGTGCDNMSSIIVKLH